MVYVEIFLINKAITIIVSIFIRRSVPVEGEWRSVNTLGFSSDLILPLLTTGFPTIISIRSLLSYFSFH